MSKGIQFEVSGERGEPKTINWGETKENDRGLINEIENIIYFKVKPLFVGNKPSGYHISNEDMIKLLTLLNEVNNNE